jgi:L-cysteine S-thiosulfotransferase
MQRLLATAHHRAAQCWAFGLLLVWACASAAAQPALAVPDGLPQPLTAVPGDVARGLAIVGSREQGLCLLCHSGPLSADFAHPQLQGNLATNLHGAGSRWTVAQLRLRIVDSRRINPDSLMPPLHSAVGGQRVGAAWQGQPLLSAQQVEDVVAYLTSLR